MTTQELIIAKLRTEQNPHLSEKDRVGLLKFYEKEIKAMTAAPTEIKQIDDRAMSVNGKYVFLDSNEKWICLSGELSTKEREAMQEEINKLK